MFGSFDLLPDVARVSVAMCGDLSSERVSPVLRSTREGRQQDGKSLMCRFVPGASAVSRNTGSEKTAERASARIKGGTGGRSRVGLCGCSFPLWCRGVRLSRLVGHVAEL